MTVSTSGGGQPTGNGRTNWPVETCFMEQTNRGYGAQQCMKHEAQKDTEYMVHKGSGENGMKGGVSV